MLLQDLQWVTKFMQSRQGSENKRSESWLSANHNFVKYTVQAGKAMTCNH